MATNWLKKYDEGGMADMEMSAPEPMAPEPARGKRKNKERKTVTKSAPPPVQQEVKPVQQEQVVDFDLPNDKHKLPLAVISPKTQYTPDKINWWESWNPHRWGLLDYSDYPTQEESNDPALEKLGANKDYVYKKEIVKTKPGEEYPGTSNTYDEAFNKYLQFIKLNEGDKKDAKTGLFMPYPSPEKDGTYTIGYGHKLKKGQENNPIFKNGLTQEQVEDYFKTDFQNHYKNAKKFLGKSYFNALPYDQQMMFTDYNFNTKKGLSGFPNLVKAIKAYDYATTDEEREKQRRIIAAEYSRKFNDSTPLYQRNASTLDTYLIPSFKIKKEMTDPSKYIYKNIAEPHFIYGAIQPIDDNRGQWAYPGEVTRIASNDITMQGVPYPVLGVGADGEQRMMYPEEEHTFNQGPVTEYPMMEAKDGGWLNKYTNLKGYPVVKDAGNYKDGIWVPDWETIISQAKQLNAKTVQTESGAIISFDDNWKPTQSSMKNGGWLSEYNRGGTTWLNEYAQGGETFTAGGEKHRVYEKESPTGNGKGVKGHIMVTHPTTDKGKWDTIDLTKIAGAKTVAQGVAATKKWHAENPEYKDGGWLNKYTSGTTNAQPTLKFNTMPIGTANIGTASDNTAVVMNTPRGTVVTGKANAPKIKTYPHSWKQVATDLVAPAAVTAAVVAPEVVAPIAALGEMAAPYVAPIVSAMEAPIAGGPAWLTANNMLTAAMIPGGAKALSFLPADVQSGNLSGFAEHALDAGLSLLPLGAEAAPFVRNAAVRAAKALGTEEGLLSNTYKINPFAFKPQEGMMYRGLGEEGFKDAMESGVFRPKQYSYAEKRSLAEKVTTPKQFSSTFYAPAEKFGVVENYGPKYLAEVPFEGNQFARRYGRKDWSWSTPKQILTDEGRILQKDWLQGYKEVPIDWTKWNPKYEKLYTEEGLLSGPYEDYFKNKDIIDNKLFHLLSKNKINWNDERILSDLYTKRLNESFGIGDQIGKGAYGTVYQLANDPNKVIKIGTPLYSGQGYARPWTPELIEKAKSIKQNKNIAIPEVVKYFKIPGEADREIMIMPNLNNVNSKRLNLNKRDRYALFLKQAKQLRDMGISLDVKNYSNFKYNPSTNLFDIYDINPYNIKNPGYYMNYVVEETKPNMLGFTQHKNGGWLNNYK